MNKIKLYIKCQTKNNIQYFGKTIQEPFKYKGSGKVWKDIHKKYSYNDVATMVLAEYSEDDPMLIEYALGFSAANNIVVSSTWANLIPEDGKGGGPRMYGKDNPMFGKVGRLNHNYKKPRTTKTKKRISDAQKGVPKSETHKQAMKGTISCFYNLQWKIFALLRKNAY